MELIANIFRTLDVTSVAFLQMALVVVLVFILSATLVRPILATFEERENRSTKPMEESRALLAKADARSKAYEEAVRKAAADALASKRKAMEEASKAERKRIESVSDEANRRLDDMKAKIAVEKDAAAAVLRDDVKRLSVAIAEKVLGRQVA